MHTLQKKNVGKSEWPFYHQFIGITLLYFKIAVMPLVAKTKMADVGKLINLGSLLVKKVMWLVLTTTSATLILSRAFGADCTTSIAYIYSRLPSIHFFSILTSRDSTHTHTHSLSLSLSLTHTHIFHLQR